jgi:hypothetical protein
MEFDPHTLHQIIQRISQQMRCPQCGEKVPVDFTCVRLTSDDFVLMQLKCIKGVKLEKEDKEKILNASSSLCMREGEVDLLRNALEKASGSFEQLFIESKEVTEKEL